MTIADRIRVEKRSKASFDSASFMESIEKWFTSHTYEKWLHVKGGDTYIEHPKLCKEGTTIREKFSEFKSNWDIDFIEVPYEYLDDAIKLLKNEGFCLYRNGKDSVVVSLQDVSCIKYGVNYWERIS